MVILLYKNKIKGVDMVKEITGKNFDTEVTSEENITIVDFYADWCGPCRKLSPIMDEVEEELGAKAKFVKINTDGNIEIAKKYQISGLPTLLLFKEGIVAERMVGLMPKSSIITNIERHL